MKQCKNCFYYLNNCGYWNKEERARYPNASYLVANAVHNCPDWKGKTYKIEMLNR